MPSNPNQPRPAQPGMSRPAPQAGAPVRPNPAPQGPPPRPAQQAAPARAANSLAYSAVPERGRTEPPVAAPIPARPAAPAPRQAATVKKSPVSPSTDRSSEINYLSIIALILSGLGITFPFGLGLGYYSRNQIDRDGTVGRPLATAAIVVGYLWLLALILGVIAYVWILV